MFHLAVTRAAEIIIGITCAMAVVGLTDTGQSAARLARSLDRLAHAVLDRFTALLQQPDSGLSDGPALRRALIGDVAALDPLIDQALGESPELRHRKAILADAVAGLFSALSGWRIAESHLVNLEPATARREARAILDLLPAAWPRGSGPAGRNGTDAFPGLDHRRDDLTGARALAAIATDDVSRRLLADAAAHVALGLTAAANGVALLRSPATARDPARTPGFVVADYLPAMVNAIRTFVAIGAGILFWIVTEWPNGLGAITFLSVTVLLLAPQQEKSGAAARGFGFGTVLAAGLAAVVNFALLPNHEGFLALALIMGIFLVPLAALSTVPALAPYLVAATMNFVPLVGPTNEITFDTLSFYNGALGIVGGCMAGAVALVVIPPVPWAIRAERLVALTLRDLRRMAVGHSTPTPAAWQSHVYARLVALPELADPVYGSRLVEALSLGLQVLRLRSLAGPDDAGGAIRGGLDRLAARDVDGLLAGLDRADAMLGASAAADAVSRSLRVRTSIQIVRDVVRQHWHEFEEAGR